MNFLKTLSLKNYQSMTETLLRKLSEKIAEIYDLEFADKFTEIFEVLVTRIKNTSKGYWSLVRKLAACEKERDMEREKVRILEEEHWKLVEELYELRGAPGRERRERGLACTWTYPKGS